MASVRFTDVQARPTEFLDFTSLTFEEFQTLVPPFEAAFQAHMAVWRLDGKPRTARQFTVYKNCPLPTPEDRLFFILVYLKTYALQVVQGRLFGMVQGKANQWIHVLLPALLATFRALGDAPARSLTALAQRLGVSETDAATLVAPLVEEPVPVVAGAAAAPVSPLLPMTAPSGGSSAPRTLLNRRNVISARPKVFWYNTILYNSKTIRYVKPISRSMNVRYVRHLTEQQRALLENTMKNDASHRARMRAHGLLLSSEGITIKAIAKIYDVDRDTVSTWMKKWEKHGEKSLHDQPRSGRPTTLNAIEKELAKQYIKEEPRSLKNVVERLAQKTAKRLSISSLKRLAKKARLRWKRVRKSLKSLRDPIAFAQCQRELEALQKQEDQGKI